ncbi:hypothetical protein E9993_16940 [Labilibacter sediminis]|nr:hypothetical protein E9993_16940 [Labilibacter sediminis]
MKMNYKSSNGEIHYFKNEILVEMPNIYTCGQLVHVGMKVMLIIDNEVIPVEIIDIQNNEDMVYFDVQIKETNNSIILSRSLMETDSWHWSIVSLRYFVGALSNMNINDLS